MKTLGSRFKNISLVHKILALVLVVGILPLGILATVTSSQRVQNSRDKLMFSANNGFNQALQAVSDKLLRVQNISTLLAMNDTINQTFSLSETDTSSVFQQLVDFETIAVYTNTVEMSYGDVNIYYYIDDEFVMANATSNRFRTLSSAQGRPWALRIEENAGRPLWVPFDQSNVVEKKGDALALTRYLWDSDDLTKSVGMLVIALEREQVNALLIESLEEQQMYIETKEGELLATNTPDAVRLPHSYRQDVGREFMQVSLEEGQYYAHSQQIPQTELYLVSLIPEQYVSGESYAVLGQMIAMFLLAMVALVTIFLPVTRRMLRPIRLLGEQMQSSSQNDGEIKKLAIETHNDEVGLLITNYNNLVDRLDGMLEHQYVLGQEKKDAELKALQSQINPHFLYNTLDMLNWMAQKNEGENIQNVVLAMSRFYRLALSRGEDIITLEEELEMCGAYMDIQKNRFWESLEYEVEVAPELLSALLPKITLQPFIENAILHGIGRKQEPEGWVMVEGICVGTEAGESGEYMLLSVADNGVGMSCEDKTKQQSGGSHYGMRNIEMRLSLYYNEPISIQVESSVGMGTSVSVRVPVRKKEENEQTKGGTLQ